MLTPEQTEPIKQQLIEQIETTFPEDKKNSAIEQIENMNEEELEEFLIKNNLIKNEGVEDESGQNCIFCSIVSGKAQAYKLDESEDALAVLEINPLSEGHTILIPKKHSPEISDEAEEFSKKIAKKIKSALNPKDVLREHNNLFGHEIINIIPIYDDETLNSKRKPVKPEELKKIQKILKEFLEKKEPEKKEEKAEQPKQKPITDKTHWLPKRKP